MINKLNKEKKHIQEINSKASEELQAADEKVIRIAHCAQHSALGTRHLALGILDSAHCTIQVSHLAMVKTKLEQTLDELEDNLDRYTTL